MSSWQDKALVIGLGPTRTGSTWIHELLFGHTEVSATHRKEVNFFNANYERGQGWYRRQFQPATARTRLFADISPLYILAPAVLIRIRHFVPEPLFLIGLRSPYARVLSWYLAFAHAPNRDLSEGMAMPWEAPNTSAHFAGVVAPTIKRYVTEFGAARMRYFDYDELASSPEKASESLQCALGLTQETLPSVRHVVQRKNTFGPLVKHPLAHACARVLLRFAPSLAQGLKYGPLRGHIFRRPQTVELTQDAIADALRPLRVPFEKDISDLEDILTRDLSHWRFERQVQELHDRNRILPNAIG